MSRPQRIMIVIFCLLRIFSLLSCCCHMTLIIRQYVTTTRDNFLHRLTKCIVVTTVTILESFQLSASTHLRRSFFKCPLRNGESQWRIYIVKFWTRAPPGVQILSILCSFWENLAISYVGAHPWRVGAPSSGKSWIRH